MKLVQKRFSLSVLLQFTLLLVFSNKQSSFVQSIHFGQDTTNARSGGFIVQLYYFDEFRCGGSLINELFVLTAQHCIKFQNNPSGYKVIGGVSYLYTDKIGKSAKVKAIKLHPQFNQEQSENDIAVLMLATPLRGLKIKPIPLCSKPYEDDDMGHLLGWGENESGPLGLNVPLQELTVPIMNWQKCRDKMYPKHGDLHRGMICTFSGDEHGVCDGDSGGPLIINDELCGVIVWYANPGCANGVMPDIHTDVFFNLKFIKNAMLDLKKKVNKMKAPSKNSDSRKQILKNDFTDPEMLTNTTTIDFGIFKKERKLQNQLDI